MSFIDQWKKSEAGAGTFVLTVVCVILGLFVGTIISEMLATSYLGYSLVHIPATADLNPLLALLLLPFAVCLLVLMLCIKHLHKRPILSVFTSRESFDWKRFFLSFGIWFFISIAFVVVLKLFGAPIEWNFQPLPFVMLFLVSFFIMPLQTTAEEVFFRGFLFQALGKLFGSPLLSILLTGVLFGLMHGSNPEVQKIGTYLLIFYVMTGIFLGLLTHFDQGLELAMGYHAANNIFAALIVTNDWQAFQTDALLLDRSGPSFGWDAWLTILLFQPALLYLYSRIYRWEKWKNVLGGKEKL